VDVLDLSRLQFAVTASFHMTFPAVTVGLSLFLVLVYWLHMRTGKEVYMEIFRFWRNLFAIGFGLGIVSGIVLTFEFGMNWGPFSNATGPITGTLLALEVVTAFFLEAGFLGIMIYGEGRVGQRVMFFSTCMVALGAFVSTTWILASNSWMQTPAGFTVIDGQFHPTDWMEAIFNPSFPLHYAHMVVATILSSALLVAGVGAWYLVKGCHAEFGRKTLSLGIGFLAVFAPLQLYTGDALGQRIVGPHQPAKLQAMEGNWDSTNTAWNLLVIPDREGERNVVQIGVPFAGSVIVHHDFTFSEPVPGLKETPPEFRPPIMWTFYGFRAMLASAGVIWALAATGIVLRLRGTLYSARWFHKATLFAIPTGVVGTIAGWIVAEVGRQPFVVYGHLLTEESASALAPPTVLASVVLFIAAYSVLLGAYAYYLAKLVRRGPDEGASTSPTHPEPGPPLPHATTARGGPQR
jgi:cytochrome bd ubiquinol oxidase subunit I